MQKVACVICIVLHVMWDLVTTLALGIATVVCCLVMQIPSDQCGLPAQQWASPSPAGKWALRCGALAPSSSRASPATPRSVATAMLQLPMFRLNKAQAACFASETRLDVTYHDGARHHKLCKPILARGATRHVALGLVNTKTSRCGFCLDNVPDHREQAAAMDADQAGSEVQALCWGLLIK